MNRIRIALAALVLVSTSLGVLSPAMDFKSVLLAGGTDDSSKADLQKLQGKWKIESIVHNGTVTSIERVEHWTISDNNVIYDSGVRHEVTLDATTKPKAMGIRIVRESEPDGSLMAIYAINGDELRICVDVTGKERPTTFESRVGSGRRLITLRKVKNE